MRLLRLLSTALLISSFALPPSAASVPRTAGPGDAAAPAAPRLVTGSVTSAVRVATLADNDCSGPTGSPPCGSPHREHHRSSHGLAVSGLAVSSKAGFGWSEASATATTSLSTGKKATFRSSGVLDAAAHCQGRKKDGVCPGGEETAAFVYATGTASAAAQIQATGRVPYILDASLHASGRSKSPCAGVHLTVSSAGTVAEDLAASGPSGASDVVDCALASAGRVSVHREGFLDATGTIDISLAADTSFIDPGTTRTDRLHADWDVSITFFPTCTISATDDPDYDPAVGAVVFGTAGDDVICGGAGPDSIDGQGGNDQVFGDDGEDEVTGHGVLVGGLGGDTICGQGGVDHIDGGPGQDLLSGGPGDDVISGDADRDTLSEDSNTALILCSFAPGIGGPSGDDHLVGGAGPDVVEGGGGSDRLEGGPAGDTLDGGKGRDVMLGGSGDDTLRADDRQRDTVSCAAGKHDSATVDGIDVVTGCERVR